MASTPYTNYGEIAAISVYFIVKSLFSSYNVISIDIISFTLHDCIIKSFIYFKILPIQYDFTNTVFF